MIYALLLAFAVVALAPLAFTLRRRAEARGRRDSAMAIHRAQLVELERDEAQGRISPAEHETAKLEIQRRLLSADAAAEPDARASGAGPILFALLAIPMAGAFLYLISGQPDMPGAPRAERLAQIEAQNKDAAGMVDKLKARIAELDPKSEQAREGYVLLGNVQYSRGNLPEAAAAWHAAVDIRFEAGLAAQAAEMATQAQGRVSPDSAALFTRALAAAPPDATWRSLVEQRLAEAAKQ